MAGPKDTAAKSKKMADAQTASICPATREMLARAQALDIDAEVCETVGIPPVLHLGSCVDNSRILLAATEVVKAGGLGNELKDLPAAGSAPEWMSEKAIAIGHYFVSSGVYTVFGYHMPLEGAPVFKDHFYEELEKVYGGKWDCEPDPIKHAHKMIAHIDKKRKELGIDKARERQLMSMEDRQKLEA
jgi:anaerobic carbon-monoxide dehydrogenase catalytic subunit